jgi:thiamine kinase-like enzyme
MGNNVEIDFLAEKLCFCFSDLCERNFILTSAGNLYAVDFDHANQLYGVRTRSASAHL